MGDSICKLLEVAGEIAPRTALTLFEHHVGATRLARLLFRCNWASVFFEVARPLASGSQDFVQGLTCTQSLETEFRKRYNATATAHLQPLREEPWKAVKTKSPFCETL